MNSKFCLTDEFITIDSVKLYRIKALKSFSNVKEGDKGGYIQSEANLSHNDSDNAWVYDNACVYGNARVYGNAIVCDNAIVCENAQVYEFAKIQRNAKISGYANVYGDATVSGFACIYDSANVYGNAWVSGYAQIFNHAHVHGTVYIYGNSVVYGTANLSLGEYKYSPIYIQGSQHSLTLNDKKYIAIGCTLLSIDKWLKCIKNWGIINNYSESQIAEYRKHLLHLKSIYSK